MADGQSRLFAQLCDRHATQLVKMVKGNGRPEAQQLHRLAVTSAAHHELGRWGECMNVRPDTVHCALCAVRHVQIPCPLNNFGLNGAADKHFLLGL